MGARVRRSTPGVLSAGELLSVEIGEPARVIRILEPHALERRRDRLREVIARRLDAVRVVFDAPYDPHNGAAVIRSAEAFGVQRIHVIERDVPFLAAREVARGSQKWVDVYAHKSVAEAVAALRESGHVLVGAHPEGELLPEDLAKIPRVAIVLGNERDGIGEDLSRACDQRVRVPMRGFVESLNVSVTAAILLNSATAGRPGDLDEETQTRLYALGLYHSVPNAKKILDASS
jgi:tRNA (guanosine-2'-O-)-methyltransferase